MVQTPIRFQPPLFRELSKPSIIVKQLDVEKSLRHLLKQDLTFKGEKTDYAAHRIHAFAAKFPPQLPRLFIRELTQPGEWVLDPMSGSGTTLVESVLSGRNVIGVDLDPLAVMIAKVKSMPLSLPQCAQIGDKVLEIARKTLRSSNAIKLEGSYSPQAIEFFDYWFEKETIRELDALVRAIKDVKEIPLSVFLQVVFSSAIITKNGALTRARDLAHSRPHRDLKRKVTQSALDVFAKRLRVTIESLDSMVDLSARAMVVRSDTRSLPLRDNSVDLIVTSPPYAANAIDYMRGHKFSLIWLGYDLKSLTETRKRYIGSELRATDLKFSSETANEILGVMQPKAAPRAAVVAHYYREMESALREMLRVLTPGKAAVLVVGSSIIQGIDIKAPTVLSELAGSVGFQVVDMARREILRDARMMPTSHNSAKNGIEARMHEEGVIGLIKPSGKQ